jgi:hypothetical protein
MIGISASKFTWLTSKVDPKPVKRHFCYRNLNKKGVWWSAKNTRTGLVEFREKRIILRNVTLKVSEAGRQRVIRDKRKNVHAGVVGEIISARQLPKMWKPDELRWIKATYNPYTMDSFMFANGLELVKVTEADFVILNKNGLWISDKSYPPIGLTLRQISY